MDASELAGLRVAIDAYGWLHKSVTTCATDLALGRPTTRYVDYVIGHVSSLVSCGVKVTLVFDGAPLPSKAGTEQERHVKREEARRLGLRLLREGNESAAHAAFSKAVDVSCKMAATVIAAAKAKWGADNEKVKWVVAPYEADAQLAFLARNNHVDVVISEDSDCLAYEVPRTVFKFDVKTGSGKAVLLSDVLRMDGRSGGLDFRGFSTEMLLHMCVLSGCDYLPSVKGVGIKNAYDMVGQGANTTAPTPTPTIFSTTAAAMTPPPPPPLRQVRRHNGNVDRLLRAQRFHHSAVPASYERDFSKALATFHHQRVFDPATSRLVPLTQLTPELAEMESEGKLTFIGPEVPSEVATAIADGRLDPAAPHLPFELDAPCSAPPPALSTHRQDKLTKFFPGAVPRAPRSLSPAMPHEMPMPASASSSGSVMVSAVPPLVSTASSLASALVPASSSSVTLSSPGRTSTSTRSAASSSAASAMPPPPPPTAAAMAFGPRHGHKVELSSKFFKTRTVKKFKPPSPTHGKENNGQHSRGQRQLAKRGAAETSRLKPQQRFDLGFKVDKRNKRARPPPLPTPPLPSQPSPQQSSSSGYTGRQPRPRHLLPAACGPPPVARRPPPAARRPTAAKIRRHFPYFFPATPHPLQTR